MIIVYTEHGRCSFDNIAAAYLVFYALVFGSTCHTVGIGDE